MRQVRQPLEVLIRGRALAANAPEHVGAEARPHGRRVGELVQAPREGRGGGVAAGEQDGHDLVAQNLGVAAEERDVVQEREVEVAVRLG